MSTAQLQASQRFLDAMGPMIANEEKMQEVIGYIQALRHSEEYETITFEELSKYLPVETAFERIRQEIVNLYQNQ